jgi:membrane associated rhomboid family serine protease
VLLHAGLLHLVPNFFAQLRLGMYAEQKWGFLRYALVWVLSGIGGSLLSCIINPGHVSVGSSGAMLGVMAALTVFLYVMPDPRDPLRQFSLLQLGVLAIVMLFVGIAPSVDFSAHVGGALVGILLAATMWGSNAQFLSNMPRIKRAWPLLAGLLIVVYFVTTIVLVYTSVWTEPLASDDL